MKKAITTAVILLLIGTALNTLVFMMVGMCEPENVPHWWELSTAISWGTSIVAVVIHDRHSNESIML